MDACAPRILVAGVGNVLRGDDGFGVAVARALMARDDLPAAVKVIETGIGGMSLVQELMSGYEALVLLDACRRGGREGELYLLEPEIPEISTLEPSARRDFFADTHYATPIRALALISAIGSLPPFVRVVGCEPGEVDAFRIGLGAPVQASVDRAAQMVIDLVRQLNEAMPLDAGKSEG